MRIALYEPDIPQNVGTVIRLGACLGAPVDLVEPFGFYWDDQRRRRAGVYYVDLATGTRHAPWAAFRRARPGRLVLLTRHAPVPYTDLAFARGDTLLLGRESAGVPAPIHAAADARVTVPLRPGLRSLNVAVVAAMLLGEAMRQIGGFPRTEPDSQGEELG